VQRPYPAVRPCALPFPSPLACPTYATLILSMLPRLYTPCTRCGILLAAFQPHPRSIDIERRTFARVFPDGMSVMRQLLKPVALQEACFQDLVGGLKDVVWGGGGGGG
jgi:hypothetical protein